MQHTRTPFPDSMQAFRWIGQEGRKIRSKVNYAIEGSIAQESSTSLFCVLLACSLSVRRQRIFDMRALYEKSALGSGSVSNVTSAIGDPFSDRWSFFNTVGR